MRASIGNYFGWDAMEMENLLVVDVGDTFRVHFGRSRDHMYLLTVMVNVNDNGIVLTDSG